MMASVAVAAPTADASVMVAPREEAQAEVEDLVSQIQADFMAQLNSTAAKMRKRGQTPKCTPDKVVFRRE